MSDRDQRTEEASQHRREEARRDGNVARSRDLTAALGLLAASVALQWVGPLFFGGARQLVSEAISGLGSHAGALTLESAAGSIAHQTLPFLLMAAPLGLALALGSVACGVSCPR